MTKENKIAPMQLDAAELEVATGGFMADIFNEPHDLKPKAPKRETGQTKGFVFGENGNDL